MTANKISAGTIARTIILLLALINQCLSMAGVSPLPIEDQQVETIITTAWTVIAALIAWWKNNSFTQAALEGDKLMHALKDEEFLDR
ncbi:phage holin [Intestinimonas massiliensis (ex Afouda et al. 2020)]|uniref:Phage holin n=1 Tax=Intestinimonas massiliensis (ex Afouda et al. 2020) TaxID=1673721 RepID=A0ABS9MD74_9FIRM|nr:phage holin [Intestinimonas massiliensis (ex Afouda et al. 2020)]MCG4528770.1 phage holin [Intestinimonas massiliensis (ex Afouda et al. 2020)]